MIDLIKLEILELSYWEHFKSAKDMALVYPLNHFRRILVETEMDKLLQQIHELKK